NNAFTYTFDNESLYSLTTTTGQGKGSAQPPPPAGFPLPYKDDFESTAVGHAPKYLSDQDGAFEAHPCVGREGRCLEQVVTTAPIPWSPLPDPFTLAGDANWTDYTVSADVRFLSDSAVTLIGRIDSSDAFIDRKIQWPSGYVLRVKPSGAWDLMSIVYGKPAATLASGDVSLDRATWHRLALRFKGKQIEAQLNGMKLVSVENSDHTHGMFGLGTEWGHAQFDNLEVAP
ncbi:MAG: DUF1080 domain-containing protein, partial [Acidobacteriaceae bacterium]|nr:DUF1080 domain-containing protein [Acidobacteriaceae bacterium]